ncbi:MAG: phosphoglucosamine mutase [Desulfobacterales bacterium]|nr:phosphoglucosamine mutase [Desulfobacterales bacterium]
MGKLFGTDGIRGKANEYPIIPETAVAVGRAVASFFKKERGVSGIIIGKDTRISGYMLEYALVSGICSMGVDAYLAGVLPTPGVAFLTASTDAVAGIVISASHNPFYDNGIKIFKENGFKLSDKEEEKIERLVLGNETILASKQIRDTGNVYKADDAEEIYCAFLKTVIMRDNPFKGIKIVIDCSNGATYRVAPKLFADLGANVESISINPDGKNINDNCGSQHPENLSKKVVEKGADIGLAFDGDGDRLIVVDEKGNILTGDQMIFICATAMKQKGELKNNLVVSTVMSNIGLKLALKDIGVEHIAADVGDRYVTEKMISSKAVLGGEESGHMIFLNHHTTGDGLLAAIKLIEAVKTGSKPVSELGKSMTVFPQVFVNIKVKSKPDIRSVPVIRKTIKSVETSLGKRGRVLVRYSGTQPLCRIMVEGQSMDETGMYCKQIADIVKKELGV